MSYEIKGTVSHTTETQVINEKFKKREFAIAVSNEVGDKIYTQHIKLQLVQDKCRLLDDINIGDEIQATFNINGSRFEKEGVLSFFTNLTCFKIDVIKQSPAKSTDLEDNGDLPF